MNIHEKINARSYLEPNDHLGSRIKIGLTIFPTTQPCANDIGWQHVKKKHMFKLKF